LYFFLLLLLWRNNSGSNLVTDRLRTACDDVAVVVAMVGVGLCVELFGEMLSASTSFRLFEMDDPLGETRILHGRALLLQR
jgi:hypothetical protein